MVQYWRRRKLFVVYFLFKWIDAQNNVENLSQWNFRLQGLKLDIQITEKTRREQRWSRYLTPDISRSVCTCECAEAIILALWWAHYWSKCEKIGGDDDDDDDDANDDDMVDGFTTCLTKTAFSQISKCGETHSNSLQHRSGVGIIHLLHKWTSSDLELKSLKQVA